MQLLNILTTTVLQLYYFHITALFYCIYQITEALYYIDHK